MVIANLVVALGKMNFLKSLLRDRLVWFALAGAALFAADAIRNAANNRLIVIDLPLVEKLAVQWQAQTKTPISVDNLDRLIEGYIREEILVREARRLGLADDDVIIRRRLAQKVEFFMANNAPPATPSQAQLEDFYKAHKQAYISPATVSFEHIFTGAEKPDVALLNALQNNPKNWRDFGQPFMLNRAYADETQRDLAQLMGADFADAVFALPSAATNIGHMIWKGPVRSAYGWHMVRLTAYQPAKLPPFAGLAERVARDWQEGERQSAIAAAWRILRQKYRVEMLPVEDAPGEASSVENWE